MNINTINGININRTNKHESLSNDNKIEINGNGDKTKKNEKINNKSEVDTSNFSIEERLISAVWVHDRKLMRSSIADASTKNDIAINRMIKLKFRTRFGKEPPAKNTLYLWEKKLFSTGNVMDAKRSGRPCRRKDHLKAVEASLKDSPGISLRARANQLGLPRTTLIKIVQDDLKVHYVNVKPKKTEPAVATNANNGVWIKSSKTTSPNRRKSKETGSRSRPGNTAESAKQTAPHSPEPAVPQPSLPSFPPPPPVSENHHQYSYGDMTAGAHFPPYMHGYNSGLPPQQGPNLLVNHHMPLVQSQHLQNVDSQQYGLSKDLQYGQASIGQVARTAPMANEYH